MKYDLIIHNGTVITMNGSLEVLHRGGVCIKNGKISRVLKRCGEKQIGNAREKIDARGGVIMPGLVNGDTHLPAILLRGIPSGYSSNQWMEKCIGSTCQADRHAVRVGAALGCAEMLLSGTTMCCDAFFSEDEVTLSLLKAGMRSMVAQPIVDRQIPGVNDGWTEGLEFVHRWNRVSPLVQPHIYGRPGADSVEMFAILQKASRELDVFLRLDMSGFLDGNDLTEGKAILLRHFLEVENVGKSALIFDPSRLPEADFLNRYGIGSVLTPGELEDVFPLRRSGILLGLGTGEWSVENGLDLFGLMRWADDADLDPVSIIRMATIDAARVIGMQERIGSIEEGKSADVIVLDVEGDDDPASIAKRIVSSTTGEQVRHVIVNGKILVSHGSLNTIDIADLQNEAENIRSQILRTDSFGHALIC